ncbi:MAG: hypothetical protein ACFFD4_37280 [Candidatus Odinarchaeota archaeon]
MLNRKYEKHLIEEEDEEETDISLRMDILSALESLENIEEITDPELHEDSTVGPLSGSATSMSLDKDPWELLDQGIDTSTNKTEVVELKKAASNLVIHEAQKLPREFTPDQLFKEAVSDLSSILDSIK